MKKWCSISLIIFLVACGSNDTKVDTAEKARAAIVNDLTEKVKQNPDSAVLRMRLINSLDSLRQYTTAIKNIDSLLAKDSMNQGLWVFT